LAHIRLFNMCLKSLQLRPVPPTTPSFTGLALHAQNCTTVYISASTLFWLRYNQLQYYGSYMAEFYLSWWTCHIHFLHSCFNIISFKPAAIATVYKMASSTRSCQWAPQWKDAVQYIRKVQYFFYLHPHTEKHTRTSIHTPRNTYIQARTHFNHCRILCF
jgi:hypothetical protein